MTEGAVRPRERRADGERTHAAILEAAARLASIDGVHGLSLGRLAEELGVSKSGLYAHFGSKEALQLETIEAAKAIFDREVMQAVSDAPEGLPQLETLFEAFFSYVERGVFPGGCFFASLLAEEDAHASGRVHDVVVAWERETIDGMSGLVRTAQEKDQVTKRVDPEQLVFELYSFIEMANFHFVLFRDPAVLDRGRTAVRAALAAAAVAR